ncbi:MAG: M50 family metallopeptidase, partial [Bacteroidota bacterium]
MQVILGILLALVGISLVLILRSLTTLFHELGHAIPSLIFTDGPVKVYVGTYGDTSQGAAFQLGRLEIFFRFNLLNWRMGMCVNQGVKTLWKNVIIILGGPVASLLISIPLIYLLATREIPDFPFVIMIVFIAAATLDFFANMIPMGGTIVVDDGTGIYNDGAMLFGLLARVGLSQEYLDLEEQFEKEQYEKVIRKTEEKIASGKVAQGYYFLYIQSQFKKEDYQAAIDGFQEYARHYKLDMGDYSQIGHAYLKLNQFEEALRYFDQYLYYNFNAPAVRIMRGTARLETGRLQEAQQDFGAALEMGGPSANLYLQKGKTELQLGNLNQSLADLNQAKALDPNLTEVWLILGKYYEKIQ